MFLPAVNVGKMDAVHRELLSRHRQSFLHTVETSYIVPLLQVGETIIDNSHSISPHAVICGIIV